MKKKIIVYCDISLGCCQPGRCYGENNILAMIRNTDITYENWNNKTHPAEVAKYGLDKSPTIILFQNDAILKKIIGKNVDLEILNLITEAPMTIKSELTKNIILKRFIEAKEKQAIDNIKPERILFN